MSKQFFYNLFYYTVLTVCCLLPVFLWGHYIYQHANVTNKTESNTRQTSGQKTPGVRYAKIQDVQVGERAIGKNPELTGEDRQSFFPDPEPATWRKLTLEMQKSDGKRLDVTLLRPLSWIEESKAEVGATICLDLPEMGAQGQAKILNIEPCPPIKPGKGNVVTGTFHHEAANTIDLYVEGLLKPIGTTDNHPFWSVTKQEFVEAGKLLPNEELQLYNGQMAKVIQILPRPGPERVHNLEVLNEHVYRITNEGALVHNACSTSLRFLNHIFNGEINRAGKATGLHHIGTSVNLNYAKVTKIQGTQNATGVYNASIEIYDHQTRQWVQKGNVSTMFPDHWSRDDVFKAIKGATNDPLKRTIGNNKYEGTDSVTGMTIIFTINKQNELTSAYPKLQ
ncbi:MAG: EndoU domain-containing protein [Planctomycetaceae bacterium]|jgi:hypothetical protein|nr:EndoU domain-containing protein [Planctomycetaceae bacterium]